MCGVFAIYTKNNVNVFPEVFDALTVLQHRGQNAAGIALTDNYGNLSFKKGLGLVRDVFHEDDIHDLHGNMGIGHVRYPTAGSCTNNESQPFYVNSPYGIFMAHNGNLTNSTKLSLEIFKDDLRHLSTDSDSEVLLNIFAHELATGKKIKPSADDVFLAIEKTHKRIEGAYAVVGVISGVGIFAFRDPNGIRPLVIGHKNTTEGMEYVVSSESVPFGLLGFDILDDVKPGEGIFIDLNGVLHRKICAKKTVLSPCLFEFVYMARPDSYIDGVSVYKARLRMGEYLSEKIQKSGLNIDVVMPIPESSRNSAIEIAGRLDIKYREGFVKNRYIGRTFIMQSQKKRKSSVRYKLSTIDLEFKNKNVLLVDDSIVRGTTSKQIIKMARDSGAKNVYFAICSPPVRFQNIYGIDMPTKEELVAHNRTENEICKFIGADFLFYQDLQDLIKAVKVGNSDIHNCDASCFDGNYITGVSKDDLINASLRHS